MATAPLVLHLTSIQAPAHDGMIGGTAAFLTRYFAAAHRAGRISIPVVVDFPICDSPASPTQCVLNSDTASIGGSKNACATCGTPLMPWTTRAKLLDDAREKESAGRMLHLGWICGLPWILRSDGWASSLYGCGDAAPQCDASAREKRLPYARPSASQQAATSRTFDLICAPLYSRERYLSRGRPVYFSDVIARADNAKIFASSASSAAPATRSVTFETLNEVGATFAFNEPSSQSGVNVARDRICRILRRRRRAAAAAENSVARSGENDDDDADEPDSFYTDPFFSRVEQTGSHQESISAVLRGAIDAAAIDSTVLETVLEKNPDIGKALRVIDVLGPSPAPPLVMNVDAVAIEVRRYLGAASRAGDGGDASDSDEKESVERVHQLVAAIKALIRDALCSSVLSSELLAERRSVFGQSSIAIWMPVQSSDYDVVRRMRNNSMKLAPW